MGRYWTSIQEVLKSPTEAVLPAFLDVKKDLTKTAVTGRELEMIEIKQEIEGLKQELRSARSNEFDGRSPVDAEEASVRIRDLLRSGAPDDYIVNALTRLGAPSDWVAQEVAAGRNRTYSERMR